MPTAHAPHLLASLALAAICSVSQACGDVADAGDTDGRSDGAPLPTPWANLDCNRAQPDLGCLEETFRPLSALPLLSESAQQRISPLGTQMGSNSVLSAIHVLAGASPFPAAPFFEETFISSDGAETLSVGGIGDVLAMGGHPHALECQASGIVIDTCVDQVVIAEAFDIAILAESPDSVGGVPEAIVVRTTPVDVGEDVFVVGYPFLDWLTPSEHAVFADSYPLVSKGKVIAVEGNGIVVDAAAFAGNSGGALLDSDGQLLGVLFTLVGHLRAQGTEIDADYEDWYAVARTTADLASLVEQL